MLPYILNRNSDGGIFTDLCTAYTERVQELYDSFAKDDFEAIQDIMNPDVELHEPKGIAGGGTHHGFDEIVKNVFSRLGTEWKDVSVVPEQYVEDGDTVVVLYT